MPINLIKLNKTQITEWYSAIVWIHKRQNYKEEEEEEIIKRRASHQERINRFPFVIVLKEDVIYPQIAVV